MHMLCRSLPSSNLKEHVFIICHLPWYKYKTDTRYIEQCEENHALVKNPYERTFSGRECSPWPWDSRKSKGLASDWIVRRASKKGRQPSKQRGKASKTERPRESRKKNCKVEQTVKAEGDVEENEALVLHDRDCDKTEVGFSKRAFSIQAPSVSELVQNTEQEGRDERLAQVHCEVEVVSWRERRISASICVEASVDHVWNVLTDYERLAEFIPNLVCSERIPCPHPGRIWLHQRGAHSAMYWHIEASVVLDLQEFPDSAEGKELHFSMVDGDFKLYAGRWILQSGSKAGTTILHYEVNVIPRLLFPTAFVEKIIKADLPVNLCALAQRAEAGAAFWGTPLKTLKNTGTMSTAPLHNFFAKSNGNPLASGTFHHLEGSSETSGKKVPLSIPASTVIEDKSLITVPAYSQHMDDLGTLVAADKSWGVKRRPCTASRSFCVDEVHLRRLDNDLTTGQHWRVITSITVEAPTEDVWAVLTAYENLPEFIPNLSQSKVLFKEENHVRILQEGCKCLLYMVLHARVVLDLSEYPKFEITFQQVEGDFDSFHGRWTLDALGNQHTLLKYVVDMKMHKDFLLPDAIVEEVVYEDLPENLCAIRDRVELGQAFFKISEKNFDQTCAVPEDHDTDCYAPMSAEFGNDNRSDMDVERPKLKLSQERRTPIAGLQRDFKVLEKELLKFIAEHEKVGTMPMRWELRKYGRVDLEKAIARMGGFIRVAARLGLSLNYKQRKPKGYWDSLENVRHEILLFQMEHSDDTSIMPSRRLFEKAGRYDLARALEKWGGLLEVAQLLGLKTRRRLTSDRKTLPRKETITRDKGPKKIPLKASFPVKSSKWLNMQNGM